MIKILIVLVVFVNFIHAYPNAGLQIINGFDADISEYPFMVALANVYSVNNHTYREINCGGTLIDPSWVLTSAYCLRRPNNTYYAYAGSGTQFKGYDSLVDTIIVHENYTQAKYRLENDIALLKLSTPLTCEFCKPIPISTTTPHTTDDLSITILGWGNANDYLQLQHINVLDQDVCLNHTELEPEPNVFCAGTRNYYLTVCDIDRGGPAVYNNGSSVVGIISCANEVLAPPSPGWFTNIAYYADWINENMKNN